MKNLNLTYVNQINNLDDLTIENETANDEGETLFKFSSTYKVEGNKVTITGVEFYTILESVIPNFL